MTMKCAFSSCASFYRREVQISLALDSSVHLVTVNLCTAFSHIGMMAERRGYSELETQISC